MVNEAKAVAQMRDVPPDVRYATPEEEIELYEYWDEKVDPVAVFSERFLKYVDDGMTPDGAVTEAILDTSAAGFVHRLKMAGLEGRLTLTEQTAWLEDMAMKSRAHREKAAAEEETDAFGV